LLAIQRLGKDARDAGLAHATGAGKQKGVVQAVVVQRVDQRLEHMLLADQFTKCAWAPFSRQDLVAHFFRYLMFQCERPTIVASSWREFLVVKNQFLGNIAKICGCEGDRLYGKTVSQGCRSCQSHQRQGVPARDRVLTVTSATGPSKRFSTGSSNSITRYFPLI